MIVSEVDLPKSSLLANTRHDYTDSFSGSINTSSTIDKHQLVKAFFVSSPKWVGALLFLRNKIVAVFGLKTGEAISKEDILKKDFRLQKGDAVGIFRVYDKSEDEIIFGEDDSHLNFRVSLLLTQENTTRDLIISTVVVFNNWLGKLYFLPVKPFHKRIVKSMLKRTLKELKN